jgi:hypothetical protein
MPSSRLTKNRKRKKNSSVLNTIQKAASKGQPFFFYPGVPPAFKEKRGKQGEWFFEKEINLFSERVFLNYLYI